MNAPLDAATVKYLTRLSRIKCTEEEVEKILHDLQHVLKYFEQIDEVDTAQVEPLNYISEEWQDTSRGDVVGDTLPREVYLANAPSHVGGMIRVPPVLRP